MHFYDLIKKLSNEKEILLFIDMDGVIASYEVGKPYGFLEKRPLTENIKKLEQIGKLPNVTLYILSICRKEFQIEEKNTWLNQHAPFFQKENRIIIAKGKLKNQSSAEIKVNYLNHIKTNKQIVLVDDDNSVIKNVKKESENVIVFQDSELID